MKEQEIKQELEEIEKTVASYFDSTTSSREAKRSYGLILRLVKLLKAATS